MQARDAEQVLSSEQPSYRGSVSDVGVGPDAMHRLPALAEQQCAILNTRRVFHDRKPPW